MKSFGLTVLVIAVVSFLFFGNALALVVLVLFVPFNRLAAPHWPWLLVAAGVLAGGISLAVSRNFATRRHVMPLFAGLWLALSVGLVGLYAEYLRTLKVAEFRPDVYVENSFFRSLHNAPAEFQFFAHAVAVKDCKLYAWSYREMAFYEVPESVGFDDPAYEWPEGCANRTYPGRAAGSLTPASAAPAPPDGGRAGGTG